MADLCHLDFGNAIEECDELGGLENFDVFAAASKQCRRRSSIVTYGGKAAISASVLEAAEGMDDEAEKEEQQLGEGEGEKEGEGKTGGGEGESTTLEEDVTKNTVLVPTTTPSKGSAKKAKKAKKSVSMDPSLPRTPNAAATPSAPSSSSSSAAAAAATATLMQTPPQAGHNFSSPITVADGEQVSKFVKPAKQTPGAKKQRQEAAAAAAFAAVAAASATATSSKRMQSPRAGSRMYHSTLKKQSPARKSSLFAPTHSTAVKQRSASRSHSMGPSSSSSSAPTGEEGTTKQQQQQQQQQQHQQQQSYHNKCLTVPLTPKLRVDQRSRQHIRPAPLSTVERELVEVEETRKREEARMEKNKRQFAMVKIEAANAAQHAVVRSTKELTVPSTPISHLAKRMGPKVCSIAAAAASSGETNHAVAASAPAATHTGPKGPTQFEPFQFATDARSSLSHGNAQKQASTSMAEIPAAEMAANFLKSARSYNVIKDYDTNHVTQPQAPRFMTDMRSKSAGRQKPLSREEKEALEMEDNKKHAFKAKPVDKKIFLSKGELGVPTVPPKPVTEQVAFSLRTDMRSNSRPSTAPVTTTEEEEMRNFKARPMPSFASTASVAASTTAAASEGFKPTVAMSPKFSGGVRASSAPARRQNPHHSVLEKEREAAKIVRVSKPSLTEPKEFHLSSVVRHAQAAAKFQEDVAHLLEKDKADFHARPLPKSTYEVAFQPEIEERAPLMPLSVTLESDIRSNKRAEFNKKMTQSLAEKEQQKEAAARAKLEQENQKIKELRRQSTKEGGMAFVANPVLTKDMYPTHKQHIPLTEPKSPYLMTKLRARNSTSDEVTFALNNM